MFDSYELPHAFHRQKFSREEQFHKSLLRSGPEVQGKRFQHSQNSSPV
jgi:hypothetical protein